MKKIVFDTNVILDVYLQREEHYLAAARCISHIEKRKAQGYIAAHAVTTIEYFISKNLSEKKTRSLIAELLNYFKIIEVNHQVLTKALTVDFSDYEDAVTYCAAREVQADAIITRNKKDFKNATIDLLLPKEFIIFEGLLPA